MSLIVKEDMKSASLPLPKRGLERDTEGGIPEGSRTGVMDTSTSCTSEDLRTRKDLLEVILSESNIEAAYRRVRKNGGSPGIDA